MEMIDHYISNISFNEQNDFLFIETIMIICEFVMLIYVLNKSIPNLFSW
jgi:hypothetical protein